MIYRVEIETNIQDIFVEADSQSDANHYVENNILPQIEFYVQAYETSWPKAEIIEDGQEFYDISEHNGNSVHKLP